MLPRLRFAWAQTAGILRPVGSWGMAESANGKPAIPWSQTITLCLLVCFGWFCLVMSIILVIVHPYLGGMHRHPISKRGLNSPSIALYFDSDWQQAQKQIEMLAIWKHNVNSIHLCNIVYIYINIYIYNILETLLSFWRLPCFRAASKVQADLPRDWKRPGERCKVALTPCHLEKNATRWCPPSDVWLCLFYKPHQL